MGLVYFVVGGELPFAVQQARLGVREIELENLVKLLARLLVILTLEGNARQHVVGLRLYSRIRHCEPLLDSLLRPFGVAHGDEQVDVAEHRLAPRFRLLVHGMVPYRLVFQMGSVELARIARYLRTSQHKVRGEIRRKLRLLSQHFINHALGLVEQLVLAAA